MKAESYSDEFLNSSRNTAAPADMLKKWPQEISGYFLLTFLAQINKNP